MKANKNRAVLFLFLAGFLCVACVLDVSQAYAQEGMSSWRRVWNNIMLFFNFGILVFVFLKYAQKPLVTLIKNMCRKVEETLNTANHQLRQAQAKLDAENERLQKIDQHLQQIQKRILQIAQAEKDVIIEHGRASAERMIENAESYAFYRISMARKDLSDEMVEMAVSLARERLSREISAQDDERFIDQFFTGLEDSKGHYGNIAR